MDERARACAASNVAWYLAVLGAHGIAGTFDAGMWTWRGEVPAYHSNAIAIDPSCRAAQTDGLLALAAELARPFSVKDAFAGLELASLGFEQLFEATWIHMDPTAAAAVPAATGVDWLVVDSEDALETWERAWNRAGSAAERRVFVPALLDDPSIRILAGRRDGELVAGLALNRSEGTVGVSNLFTVDGPGAVSGTDVLDAAVVEAARFAPGSAVVGFERGEALERALGAGFERAGALRIWTWNPRPNAG